MKGLRREADVTYWELLPDTPQDMAPPIGWTKPIRVPCRRL